jgi:hypothetical protein
MKRTIIYIREPDVLFGNLPWSVAKKIVFFRAAIMFLSIHTSYHVDQPIMIARTSMLTRLGAPFGIEGSMNAE